MHAVAGGLVNALDTRIAAIVGPMIDRAMAEVSGSITAAIGGGPDAPAPRRPAPPKPSAAPAAPGRKPRAGGGEPCNVVGCGKPQRSKGYCAACYQAARKYEWPMPAPAKFVPPPRPPRGRPPKFKAPTTATA